MNALLTVYGGAGHPADVTTILLADFLTENADGIGQDEAAAIEAALAAGNRYEAGGGAAVAWTLEPVTH
ncbi:MAG: hypothetical protein JWO51_168 [Rhodospirillales bacterium]|nr:hypothetical protein [Rhodospirillales bacterium]